MRILDIKCDDKSFAILCVPCWVPSTIHQMITGLLWNEFTASNGNIIKIFCTSTYKTYLTRSLWPSEAIWQYGVSNHQPHGCLLNRLFRRRSKKTSKLRVTGLCVGNSPEPVNSPHKGPVTRKIFPFDDVIMMTRTWTGNVRLVFHRYQLNTDDLWEPGDNTVVSLLMSQWQPGSRLWSNCFFMLPKHLVIRHFTKMHFLGNFFYVV